MAVKRFDIFNLHRSTKDVMMCVAENENENVRCREKVLILRTVVGG
jgi:hypothetical protein